MKQTPQIDFHPDAESLNAFAERVLPDPERAQILGHIAGCSRCRQILYLAQEVADEMEAPARTAAQRPEKQPSWWTVSWRLAWIPAGALAVLVGVAIVLHFRPVPPSAEMAEAAPQGLNAPPSPASRPPASAEKAKSAAKPGVPKAAATDTEEAAAPIAGRENPAVPELTAEAPQTAAPQAAPPARQPETAVAAWQQEQQRAVNALSTQAEAAAKVTQAKMHSAADRIVATGASAYTAAAAKMEMKSAPSSSFDGAAPTAGLVAARKPAPARLPSGLTSLSTATAQHHTVAIDPAGALFASEDSGRSWEQVQPQWTGRAVQVRARTFGAGAGSAAAPEGSAEHGSGVPTARASWFEMVNDAGQAWVSADGKTWRAR
jgi:hypothetical protein